MSGTGPRCLLITDDQDTAPFVTGILEADFLPLAVVDRSEAVVIAFEEHQPPLVILSFHELEGAERALLDLYRNSLQINAIEHRTVLLCQAAAASTAYELCRRGIFDDYVITKPLYDPHHLNLALTKAQAEMASVRNGAWAREVRNVQREVQDFFASVRESAASGDALQRDTASTFARLSTALIRRLQTFLEVSPHPMGTASDPEALADLANRFARDHLGAELGRAQTHIERSVQGLADSLHAQCESHGAAMEHLASLAARHEPLVIIIEDNELDADVLSTLLAQEGFETEVASTGMAGLALVAHRTPDLVLLDFELPDLTGLDLLRRLRGAEATAEIPVIFATGHSEKEIVSDCISLGVEDFLVKPVQKAVLLEKVHKTMVAGDRHSR